MRFNLLLSLIVLAGAALGSWQAGPIVKAEAAPVEAAAGRYRAGVVLVRFRPGASSNARRALATEGLEVMQEIPRLRVLSVAVPPGAEAVTAARLARRSDVLYAEPDYIASAQIVPNDSNYAKQWGLEQIAAPQAWDITTGAADVIIAVVDSGIDTAHPDLVSKLWRNSGEVPANGKDDDGNGYVDDVNGWRFYSNGAGGDWRVKDDNGHGTHVAGIAAAATNNGAGIAGVAWSSPIMAVKVLDTYGNAFYSDIASGIIYAIENRARIVNLSLGGAAASQTLCDAVATAVEQGVLVVAAAGNTDRAATVLYPAMCPGALAVAATDRSDQRATFSIAGPRVDLAAPGVDIWSTWYQTGTGQSTYNDKQGTSEAAPFVSGAAALVWSRWPELDAAGVKTQLLATVKDVGAPGKDYGTGWGRLDAAAALAAPALQVDLRLSASISPRSVVAGNSLTATFTIANTGTAAATSVTLNAMLPADPAMDEIQSDPAGCRLIGSQLTCGVNRLSPGAEIVMTVVMTPTQVGPGVLTTAATVSAAQPEQTPGDNGQTVKSTIVPMLSGRVFFDSNGDGIRQAWETRGVADAGLFVEQSDQPVAYQPSQAPDGAYQFDTLAFGAYVVRIELPGWQLTTPEIIALHVEPAKATVVYFGVWQGVAEPTPTMTPIATPSPTPSATPGANRSATYLPLIVR